MYKNISRFCCSVKIATGAVVCVESEIRGDVTIGKTMPSNRSSENLLFSHSRSVPRQESSLFLITCCTSVSPGARTVVHPKARIIAEAGPIVIGEGNLIEEQALIINRLSKASVYHVFH